MKASKKNKVNRGSRLYIPKKTIYYKWIRNQDKKWRKTTLPGIVTELNEVAEQRDGQPLVSRETIWDIWTMQGNGFLKKIWMAVKIRFGIEVKI